MLYYYYSNNNNNNKEKTTPKGAFLVRNLSLLTLLILHMRYTTFFGPQGPQEPLSLLLLIKNKQSTESFIKLLNNIIIGEKMEEKNPLWEKAIENGEVKEEYSEPTDIVDINAVARWIKDNTVIERLKDLTYEYILIESDFHRLFYDIGSEKELDEKNIKLFLVKAKQLIDILDEIKETIIEGTDNYDIVKDTSDIAIFNYFVNDAKANIWKMLELLFSTITSRYKNLLLTLDRQGE